MRILEGKCPTQSVLMKTKQAIGILLLRMGLFWCLITTNNQLDCNILISLLPEEKSLKIASKLGFLAPGLDKMDKSYPSKDFCEKWKEFHSCLWPTRMSGFGRLLSFGQLDWDVTNINQILICKFLGAFSLWSISLFPWSISLFPLEYFP